MLKIHATYNEIVMERCEQLASVSKSLTEQHILTYLL